MYGCSPMALHQTEFEFTPDAQTWPRAVRILLIFWLFLNQTFFQLNTAIGGNDDSVYLIINDIGSLSGEGLDFIDGMTFLERFFTVWAWKWDLEDDLDFCDHLGLLTDSPSNGLCLTTFYNRRPSSSFTSISYINTG